MEGQLLPIVPFGKYKDKSVLDLLADEKYVEWLKQQSWFSKQTQIYNIVVHQTISATNNSKTPEHNKLQNLFLDKNNQVKLLSKIFKVKINNLNNLFLDEDIVRCFGENSIPEFINNIDNTSIKFEDKFNWDLVLYYEDRQYIDILTNLEIEIFDREKYKKQYDIEENENYVISLSLIDKLIERRIKLDQEGMNEYNEKTIEYTYKLEKYEDDLKKFLQQKPQNDKAIEKYENELQIYKSKRNNFITQQQKLICQEFGINYKNFVNWYVIDTGYSHLDKDNTHTTEEKTQLKEIVDNKLKPYITEYEKINTQPNFVRKINIPIKPSLPEKYDFKKSIPKCNAGGDDLFEKVYKNKYMRSCYYYLDSVDILNEYKKKFENEYEKNYEKNFNEHYEKYRLHFYEDLIKKYCNENVRVYKTNETQYKISIKICNYDYAVCCELKPTLSDDYPVVLRKLKTQIELTQNDKTHFEGINKKYILIIGCFTSINVSKEQLITIFKQSNINIIFTDDLFEPSTQVAIKYINRNTTTEQVLFENKLIEENKFLTDNLLQIQQKLLQAEEKMRNLEEEIQSLKSQKQSKSIKDYFGKK